MDEDPTVALERAAARFVEALGGATPEELAWRPAAGGWTIGDVAEHVALATAGIAGRVATGLRPLERPSEVLDEDLPYLFYRGDEPPGVAVPGGTWVDAAAAAAEVRVAAERLDAATRGGSAELRTVGARHPVFGILDGVQWVGFAAAHLHRHRVQVLAWRDRFAATRP